LAQRAERVLDAGALLNSNFFLFERALIPPSVADEVKSRSEILVALIESGSVRIKSPSEKTVGKVRAVATEMGETGALSEADIDALALALEEKAVLITDDFHVQNVAEALGVEYQHVTERIREKRHWKRRCVNCGKTYPQRYRGVRCPICGGRIVYSSN